jgi:hypothetical protein
MTGLLLNRTRNWQHEPHLLEDEKLGEPQSTNLKSRFGLLMVGLPLPLEWL